MSAVASLLLLIVLWLTNLTIIGLLVCLHRCVYMFACVKAYVLARKYFVHFGQRKFICVCTGMSIFVVVFLSMSVCIYVLVCGLSVKQESQPVSSSPSCIFLNIVVTTVKPDQEAD